MAVVRQKQDVFVPKSEEGWEFVPSGLNLNLFHDSLPGSVILLKDSWPLSPIWIALLKIFLLCHCQPSSSLVLKP